MAPKTHGRRAASTPVKTPLTELTEALSANSGTVGRRAAVVAAAGGLIAAVGLPTANQAANDDAGVVSASADAGATTEFSNQAKTVVPEASDKEDDKAEALPGTAVSNVAKAEKAPEPEPEPEPETSAPSAGDSASDESSSDDAGESRGSDSSRSEDRSSGSEEGGDDVSIPDGSKAEQVLAIAKQYVGVPYVSGGTSPSGWDCSGYTTYVYGKVGVNLPRTSGAQKGAGQQVSRSEAQPGDLIWSPGHLGIYAGDGMMYDAGNSRVNTSYRSIDWMVQSGAVFVRVL